MGEGDSRTGVALRTRKQWWISCAFLLENLTRGEVGARGRWGGIRKDVGGHGQGADQRRSLSHCSQVELEIPSPTAVSALSVRLGVPGLDLLTPTFLAALPLSPTTSLAMRRGSLEDAFALIIA